MAMRHRVVNARGTRIHLVEEGEGPLVLLVHGFPESWYSWRHQLPALARAGYRAAAIDVRGYGGSDKPHPVEAYAMAHMGAQLRVTFPTAGVYHFKLVDRGDYFKNIKTIGPDNKPTLTITVP